MSFRKYLACAIVAGLLAGCSGGSNSQSSSSAEPSASAGAMGSGGAMSGAMHGPMMAQAPIPASLDCGATQPVWANTKTKVYHEPSDPMYGRTKNGQYICASAAVKAGYHKAGGKWHHHGGAMGGAMKGSMSSEAPSPAAT
ncbi:MAG TPA: hypothetical protein VMA98_00475 [Candidatus Acidoferrales bacterium]|nr:hypothetical protein [Candidatus Acidoferrales bacterium]